MKSFHADFALRTGPVRLKIVQAGAPVLREVARLLAPQLIRSAETQRLILDMRETMHDAPGCSRRTASRRAWF